MNKEKSAPSFFGAVSLLVIFAVLSLVIFAVLSLGTASAGDRLSSITTKSALEYAEAEFEANTILARMREGDIPSEVTKNGDVYEFSCEINDRQRLFVKTELGENGSFKIIRWQSVRTSDWKHDEGLDVWMPEN